MEGDAATGSIVVEGTLGDSLDRGGSTRRTDQRFLVPIGSDQNQRFRRPVLLDAPASHGLPFRWGLVARDWLTPPTMKFMAAPSGAPQRRARRFEDLTR